MNQILVDFFTKGGSNNKGITLTEMLEVGDNFFEKTHDFVQWMLPLTEPSMHNPDAPLLDQETIEAIYQSDNGLENLSLAGERFLQFLQRKDENGKALWISPRNHNFLRITRVIRCFKLFGQDEIAQAFFDLANVWYQKYPEDIGTLTLKFWEVALSGEMPEGVVNEIFNHTYFYKAP